MKGSYGQRAGTAQDLLRKTWHEGFMHMHDIKPLALQYRAHPLCQGRIKVDPRNRAIDGNGSGSPHFEYKLFRLLALDTRRGSKNAYIMPHRYKFLSEMPYVIPYSPRIT